MYALLLPALSFPFRERLEGDGPVSTAPVGTRSELLEDDQHLLPGPHSLSRLTYAWRVE